MSRELFYLCVLVTWAFIKPGAEAAASEFLLLGSRALFVVLAQVLYQFAWEELKVWKGSAVEAWCEPSPGDGYGS